LLCDNIDCSLLHLALTNNVSDIADVIVKVRYLSEQCPALICLKNDNGAISHYDAIEKRGFSFECVKMLCHTDTTVVRVNDGYS
jgi:hypothetical protein